MEVIFCELPKCAPPRYFMPFFQTTCDSNMLSHVAQQKLDDLGKGFVSHHFESPLALGALR